MSLPIGFVVVVFFSSLPSILTFCSLSFFVGDDDEEEELLLLDEEEEEEDPLKSGLENDELVDEDEDIRVLGNPKVEVDSDKDADGKDEMTLLPLLLLRLLLLLLLLLPVLTVILVVPSPPSGEADDWDEVEVEVEDVAEDIIDDDDDDDFDKEGEEDKEEEVLSLAPIKRMVQGAKWALIHFMKKERLAASCWRCLIKLGGALQNVPSVFIRSSTAVLIWPGVLAPPKRKTRKNSIVKKGSGIS